LVYQDTKLIAVMPAYLKQHSYGEYVFDHAWADAYQRYGQAYYPKLVTAIPFSPVSGPRICIAEGHDKPAITAAICAYIKQHCIDEKLSSWHLLFPTEDFSNQLSADFMQRTAVHFQWLNEGFTDFEDFLSTFSSRKRKNLKKERQHVVDQGITLEVFTGRDIPTEIWERFYHFYQMTYAKRSGHGGYLSKMFFQTLAKTMPESIVLVLAKHEDEYIAGALNFRDHDTLYGRYWGCIQEFKHLHFETCYYQGIDYCISEGLKRFDPGVQGEHKIQRGFRPVYTYSNHWIAEPGFRDPIKNFLVEEKTSLETYHADACGYLPFKKT
jgi:predicted N-acyltransferase